MSDHTGDMVEDLLGVYSRIVTLADRGKWRERTELLQTLDTMAWWDNYGEHVYNVRMSAVVHIADMVHDDDLPADLRLMIAEARDAVGYVDMDGEA